MAVVTACQIGRKTWVADQITKILLHVTSSVEPKVLGRRMIKPLDTALGIEQSYAIRRGLQRT
jgi:hypothetical protein